MEAKGSFDMLIHLKWGVKRYLNGRQIGNKNYIEVITTENENVKEQVGVPQQIGHVCNMLSWFTDHHALMHLRQQKCIM